MRIVEFWEEVQKGCFILKRSTKPGAQGAIRISNKSGTIAFENYATFLSAIHNLTAFPASIIMDSDTNNWWSMGSSNEINLEAESLKRTDNHKNIYLVNTAFKIPKNYNGPHYQKRVICFDKKSLKILWVKMGYEDGTSDLGKFTYTKKGFKIRWQCEYGSNKHNVSFF